ncbi:TIGR02452 family protein [Paenibacillus sp. H1-7]|nr:TIGR02452 family protein [Paenibacillus sp. H1-7]
MNDNREIRSKMAKETLEILKQGCYINGAGEHIQIGNDVKGSVEHSMMYSPDMLSKIKQYALERIRQTQDDALPPLEVTNESTLHAAERLVVREGWEQTVCLNFASAKNPGGGFLGGSQAQEESLARSSALYPCISQMKEMYDYNKSIKTCLYSDYMIYSPKIPVFREDRGKLLLHPYPVSMITAPAVNAGVVQQREPHNVKNIEPVMLERVRFILAVAAFHNELSVILGAYGCGVFRNDPSDIAKMFKQVLIDERFASLFDKVVFAILDNSADKRVFKTFTTILTD